MSFGIDKAAETLGEMLHARMRAAMEGSTQIESPIERLLALSLIEYSELGFIQDHNILGLRVQAPQPNDGYDDFDLYMDRQVRVLDWPVDFVFTVFDRDEHAHRLAVECDGHDFHERTKEQAARDRSRDRALQAEGLTVMRFTGSEIYRDPIKCVVEVMNWASLRIKNNGH